MNRYDPIHPARAMREIDGGEYVRYDDAQAALKEKDAEIARLQDQLEQETNAGFSLVYRFAELQLKCEERGQQIEDCAEYLKEGETPAECIKRHRNGVLWTTRMLAKERKRVKELEKDAERWRDLVSHQTFNNNKAVGYAINQVNKRILKNERNI